MKAVLCIVLLIFFSKAFPGMGQTPSPETAELKARAVPIDTSAWGQSLRANAGLNDKLKSYAIVGLGEQSHGTHEFYRNKAQLIRFLVTGHGFGAIGLEAPMAEVALLNAYVQTGQGEVKEILKAFRQFTFETREFVDLVEWVKGYNASRGQKVRFFGFDFQSPFACLDYFAQYGKGSNPKVKALADSLKGSFLQLSNELYSHQFDPGAFEELAGLSGQLIALLQPAGGAAGPQQDALGAYVESYRQCLMLNDPARAYDVAQLSQLRDSLMSRNVLSHWRADPAQKLILWAHNAHVQKTPNAFSASMGQYLRTALAARYGAVGQTTSRGFYTAFSGEAGKVIDRNPIQAPTPRQMEYYLQAVGIPVFALDLSLIKSPKLRAVNSYKLIVYGATDKQAMPGKITDDFDLIVHTDYTTGAKNFYLK